MTILEVPLVRLPGATEAQLPIINNILIFLCFYSFSFVPFA